jgi:hypothetical protein
MPLVLWFPRQKLIRPVIPSILILTGRVLEEDMKQKFLIKNDLQNGKFVIHEYGELDKDIFSLLCEETFGHDTIERAAGEGKPALIATLRTRNMYPPGIYAEKIAESVLELLESRDEASIEVFFNDIDALAPEEPEEPEEIEEAALENGDDESIDGMLAEDSVDELKEDLKIKKTRSGLKVADEESADPPDES